MQTEYNYTIYVGIDENDKLNSYIHDIESFGDNIIVVPVNGSTFTKAVNTIAEKAVKDGVDYLMRVNDDTQFVTSSWTSLCIESLQNFDPPNIGVVGPLCPQDKQSILTQDFVHVTHFHIFGFYYPPQLDNWWADDWITSVYGPSRSKRLTAWKVIHLTKARRYRVNMHHEKLLPQFVSQGNKTLTSYINRNIIMPLNACLERINIKITDIKNDISTIHKDHLKLQSEVNEIREKQASYEEILKSTHQYVDVLDEITENLRLDIDHVNNTTETHYDTLSRLTEEVERFNIKSISNNMRVFGLSVENISTYSDLVKYVLENVLKIACPTFKWSTDDITNIRTIPSSDSKNSPLVIVTFRYEDDKHRVFNGRDLLRKNLIRVGDDLTYNQRQSLKRLKNNESKIGYFYKGKLCVRNDNLISESSTDRVYRHARRLVTPVINPPSTDQEMDHQ
ncbi:hypothetical protein ACF0H5_005382 [Mactra antiquata]